MVAGHFLRIVQEFIRSLENEDEILPMKVPYASGKQRVPFQLIYVVWRVRVKNKTSHPFLPHRKAKVVNS